MAPSSRLEACPKSHRPPPSPSTAQAGDTRGWRAGEQLTLAPTIQAAHRANAAKVRDLLNRAITENRISLVQLAAETGMDEKQLGRALREDGGAHPPFILIAAVMHLDRLRIFATGLATLVGCDLVERKPDLAAENRQLRTALLAVRSEIDTLLGQ